MNVIIMVDNDQIASAKTQQSAPRQGKVSHLQELSEIGSSAAQHDLDEIEIYGLEFTDVRRLDNPASLGEALEAGPFRLEIQDDVGKPVFIGKNCIAKNKYISIPSQLAMLR